MNQKDDPDLKALQKIWYDKLRQSGFQDIENTHGSLKQTWYSSHCYRFYTVETFEDRRDYWRRCSHFLHAHTFETEKEKLTWELYCEGLSLRQIAEKLRTKKDRVNKDSINKIVSKLIRIMKTTFEATDD